MTTHDDAVNDQGMNEVGEIQQQMANELDLLITAAEEEEPADTPFEEDPYAKVAESFGFDSRAVAAPPKDQALVQLSLAKSLLELADINATDPAYQKASAMIDRAVSFLDIKN